MSLDIGEAFGEGLSKFSSRPGASLAAAFVAVALLSAVLSQTLQVEALEAALEAVRAASPEQLDMSQSEYDEQVRTLEQQVQIARQSSPFALDVPLSVAAAGLLVVALLSETASIVAVRAFAADDVDSVTLADVRGSLDMATLNGFVGGIVVWGLIAVGSVFLLLPGLFFATVFYFLRQEIALEDRNFIDALAASWRLTKGERLNVFALGLLVSVVTQLGGVASLVLGDVSVVAGTVVGIVLGGVLSAFGAAVATQGYLQLTDAEDDPEETTADPYDAALGPDDIPE